MKSILTIFEEDSAVRQINLWEFRSKKITFGRSEENDIVISSPIVSSEHGFFWINHGEIFVVDDNSTNGTFVNGERITKYVLRPGDMIKIDDMRNPLNQGVSIVYDVAVEGTDWTHFPLSDQDYKISIGRDGKCDICINHISVSKIHAYIQRKGSNVYIIDNHSGGGVSVNGRMVKGRTRLSEKDMILIANTKLIYTSGKLSFYTADYGMEIQTDDLVKTVKGKDGEFNISDHITTTIHAGEFVAIIGGSGAGKTTFMNCISGYDHISAGNVLINGVDLEQSYDIIKKIIGYVPQQDIVYDNLTLFSMLEYASKLRMPDDVDAYEREENIRKVISMVELEGKEDTFIYSLSGGQKKRASIAVELLSDPNLFFLDEPTSGLDPGTETHIMNTLRKLSDKGKTVILVTHNIANLDLCDRLIILGKGGRLCFSGAPDQVNKFFGIRRLSEVYDEVTDHSEKWQKKFAEHTNKRDQKNKEGRNAGNEKSRRSIVKQCLVLSVRYIKLVRNDIQRALLLLLQAPFLAVLIYFVASGKQYDEYEVTKSILFALSCCGFWIGILNAIQEICKERNIFRREYKTGLHIRAYLGSKYIVLGMLCMIQSFLLIATYALLVGLPETGIMMSPFLELFVTTFLTAMSASSMGLFVSSLFMNADRAMTVAPILLMPQILFSGLVFELSGLKEKISIFVSCRWTMEGYGSTADLNSLDLKLQSEFPQMVHEAEDMFLNTVRHLGTSWLMQVLFILFFAVLCCIALYRQNVRR